MAEPEGKIEIRRGADAPGGALVMREDVVQAWISAYRQYAADLEEIANRIKFTTHKGEFGNLDSLRQLAQGYRDLMVTGDESLYGRLMQFSARASEIADRLQAEWGRLQTEDAAAAASLTTTRL